MHTISQQDNKLNEQQCTRLVTKLSTIMDSSIEMITSTKQSFEVRFVVELCCIIHTQKEALENACGSGDWCHVVFFNNREAFRELLFDLECCRTLQAFVEEIEM